MTNTIAQQVATRADTTRLAAHQEAVDGLRRLGLPLEAPDPVAVIDAKIAALVDLYNNHPWEEFDIVASLQFAASADILRAAREVSVGVYGG